MELKPIRHEAEYAAALAEIERLWEAPSGSAEADRLEVLSMLMASYEKAREAIVPPDPIAFLEQVMDARSLSRKDLEPFIGPRGRVADVLNRTRPLSVTMIRRLCAGLDLPVEVMIQPYPLRDVAAA